MFMTVELITEKLIALKQFFLPLSEKQKTSPQEYQGLN